MTHRDLRNKSYVRLKSWSSSVFFLFPIALSGQHGITSGDCIARVITFDDSLGSIRNQECKTLSLAMTIRNYTHALAHAPFRNCPKNFKKAFHQHRRAWIRMIPFVKKYPELRGEMHILFDHFEKGPDSDTFTPLLKEIWDTWGEIEKLIDD